MKATHGQAPAPAVPATAKQGAEARDWSWVEDYVWTERMVAALVNGVKGGCWFSLIDKVYAPATLAAAWTKVKANKGAAGVDGQSIERFAARSETYLAELASELRAKRSSPSSEGRRGASRRGARTGRRRSGGWKSPRTTAERDRSASRRSRTALSKRR